MISKVYSPAFCLILWMLLLAIVPQSHAQQPSVPPQEGDTLDNITISEAEARNIMKGLFDLPRLTHSLALGRIAKDERLTAFTDGFMQRNNIQVLTIGYIDSDEFWPRIFRQQRLNKINKADNDNLLAAKIIFTPIATDGPPTGYTTTLELAGKTSTVYELLSISQAEVDSIAASTSQQQLGNTTFATPNEAKETVVSALIAALQRVEFKASPQDALALVTFQAAPADDTGLPTYGFDQMVYEQLAADYPTATIAGQTVRTAWKSLKSNAPDKVTAVAAGEATPVFEMNGLALTATPGNANTYKVSLMGASDGTASEVLALTSADNGQTMGLLNTISYDEEIINVKIVPINGAGTNFNLLGLQQKLNTIYQPAVASWQVQVLASVTLPDTWNGTVEGLADTETGMLSNYTAEMNDLIKAYLQGHDRDKDAYYIFLVDKAETPGKKGYMPRKKQWGFAFADVHGTSDDALAKTIAHELGHGVFRLEHTFSEKGLPQSQTTNLMDYTDDGTDLYKYQWDYVHDPVNVVTLFDGDEEASLYDCPRWFGTDEECESVGKLLEIIKDAATMGLDLMTRGPGVNKRNITAEDIYLDGEKFEKIRLINLVTQDEYVSYKPRNYNIFSEPVLTVDGSTEVQHGIVLRAGQNSIEPNGLVIAGAVVFKIIVYEDDDIIQQKIRALEEYLFGEIGLEESSETKDDNSNRYIIWRSDANIRSSESPYELLRPAQFLDKGMEVAIIENLTTGPSGRSLVSYKNKEEKYCTSTSNLMQIVRVNEEEQYKIRENSIAFSLPYSEILGAQIETNEVLYVSHTCGDYRLVNKKQGSSSIELGWVEAKKLMRLVDFSRMSVEEFKLKYNQAATLAVDDIVADWKTSEAACNLCVRATVLNLTGDDVLYPLIGGSTTIRDEGEQIYGKVVSGDGSAQGIIDDLDAGILQDSFEEIKKLDTDTYPQYWEKLQNLVDNNKQIIIGTYDPGHIFMVVPSGLYKVVDNTEREDTGENKTDTKIELGDRWGGSFARREIEFVLRIMDCGAGVKFSNGPVYGVMDARPLLGLRPDRVVKFYKYKQ
jgi:hypothetical protein